CNTMGNVPIHCGLVNAGTMLMRNNRRDVVPYATEGLNERRPSLHHTASLTRTAVPAADLLARPDVAAPRVLRTAHVEHLIDCRPHGLRSVVARDRSGRCVHRTVDFLSQYACTA